MKKRILTGDPWWRTFWTRVARFLNAIIGPWVEGKRGEMLRVEDDGSRLLIFVLTATGEEVGRSIPTKHP